MQRFRVETSKTDQSAHVTIDVSDSSQHSEKVLAWRQEEFERMGFVSYVADYLASTRIDLTQMEKLLKAGCPHDTAIAILKGTMWSGNDPHDHYEDEESDEPAEDAA